MELMRGVNLGGWLVLERWITPSLFDGVEGKDEYRFCEQLGKEQATERLRRHRSSFITEDHIRQIAELGLELVRLPVGYWFFGSEEPFIDGADECADKLFRWADKYGLKVILDVHAAPGSQNGNDHSGKAGSVEWHLDRLNIDKTLNFIEILCERYGREDALLGVEVLNEPGWEISIEYLASFYLEATELVRSGCPDSVNVIVHDGFRPEAMSRALLQAGLDDVILDLHLYQLYTPEDRALDLKGHIKKTEKEWGRLLKTLSKRHRLLIGEWSAAMSELYEEVGDTASHDYRSEDYDRYAQVQQAVFARYRASWTYWTARTEDGGVWSLLDNPHLLVD